jgi:CIC family chloride channel protein
LPQNAPDRPPGGGTLPAASGAAPPLRLPKHPLARLYDRLRGSAGGLAVLATVVGAGAGVGAIVFRLLIHWFTLVFTGYPDYSAVGRVAHGWLPQLGPWFVVLAPVAGGLIYGPLIHRFAHEARGHGVPEVMLAVAEQGGRIRPRVAIIKALASALCIGSGGSVGREGPIVQIGAALGSSIGQRLRVPESRLTLLLACGAAAGIAATFNAPIAGVFFGLELILRDFQTESFSVVVLASVVASVVARAVLGNAPFLTLPPFAIVTPWEFFLYGLLGVVAALVGIAFVRVLYGLEDACDRLFRVPEALRPAVGGVLLGLLLFALPQLYGVGYPVLSRMFSGGYTLGFLLLLLGGKMLATSLTIGIGGSGGVFAPSLFMGAALGGAYGDLVHRWWPAATAAPGAYALVGMGAVFAGAARAPITSILMLFELTGDYAVILPLMFAVAIATGISRALSRDTIYTLKLRRRGIDILRGRAANVMEVLTVADALRPIPRKLERDAPLAEVIARLAQEPGGALPVVDAAGAYRGTVTSQGVEEAVRANTLDASAENLAVVTPTVTSGDALSDALHLLVRQGRMGLPVLDPQRARIVGWLTHADVLQAYEAHVEQGVSRVEQSARAPEPPAPEPPPVDRARLGAYRIVDLELGKQPGRPPRRVRELALPPFSLLLAVRRGGGTLTPSDEMELRKGDRLTFLVASDHVSRLAEAIGSPRPARPT